jgi:hypothetical protein
VLTGTGYELASPQVNHLDSIQHHQNGPMLAFFDDRRVNWGKAPMSKDLSQSRNRGDRRYGGTKCGILSSLVGL